MKSMLNLIRKRKEAIAKIENMPNPAARNALELRVNMMLERHSQLPPPQPRAFPALSNPLQK
jgi:hypothetical protein